MKKFLIPKYHLNIWLHTIICAGKTLYIYFEPDVPLFCILTNLNLIEFLQLLLQCLFWALVMISCICSDWLLHVNALAGVCIMYHIKWYLVNGYEWKICFWWQMIKEGFCIIKLPCGIYFLQHLRIVTWKLRYL